VAKSRVPSADDATDNQGKEGTSAADQVAPEFVEV
jgi:hypothetical protein